jgi:HAD superfamily hydrolase (TIGR01549 family)
MKGLPLQAICFDLGGTLWDDYPTELHHWNQLVEIFARHGIATSLDEFKALSEKVIHSYSPSLTRAMIWQTARADREVYEAVVSELIDTSLSLFRDPASFRKLNPLRRGVIEMLEELSQRYALAIISQNFSEATEWISWYGLGRYFKHVALSQREMLYKPDPRLFMRACEALDVPPTHTMMVGDRLDNDIWPANRLRMHTVRILADPYRVQQPRDMADLPDHTIEEITELPAIVAKLEVAV